MFTCALLNPIIMIINTRTITDPNFSKEFPSYKKNTPKYLQTLKIICNPPLNKSQIISEMCIAEYSNQRLTMILTLTCIQDDNHKFHYHDCTQKKKWYSFKQTTLHIWCLIKGRALPFLWFYLTNSESNMQRSQSSFVSLNILFYSKSFKLKDIIYNSKKTIRIQTIYLLWWYEQIPAEVNISYYLSSPGTIASRLHRREPTIPITKTELFVSTTVSLLQKGGIESNNTTKNDV
jgi:hypothetical protein